VRGGIPELLGHQPVGGWVGTLCTRAGGRSELGPMCGRALLVGGLGWAGPTTPAQHWPSAGCSACVFLLTSYPVHPAAPTNPAPPPWRDKNGIPEWLSHAATRSAPPSHIFPPLSSPSIHRACFLRPCPCLTLACPSTWSATLPATTPLREKKGYSGVSTYASTAYAPLSCEADCLGSGEDDIDREGR